MAQKERNESNGAALAAMSRELEAWCLENGHEYMSADELHTQLCEMSPRTPKLRSQIAWLRDFCDRWERIE